MIRIGPAGWSYPNWEGSVYPPKASQPRGFDALVQLFMMWYPNSAKPAANLPTKGQPW